MIFPGNFMALQPQHNVIFYTNSHKKIETYMLRAKLPNPSTRTLTSVPKILYRCELCGEDRQTHSLTSQEQT